MLPRLAEGRSVDLNWDVLGMRATRSDSLILDLDHVGPLTRSVSDNALMIEVIAGHDPIPAAPPRPPGTTRPDWNVGYADCASGSSDISTTPACQPIPKWGPHWSGSSRRCRSSARRSAMSACRRLKSSQPSIG
jgi:hypothetical protein